MNTKHMQPITTNARQGRALSTLNRRKGTGGGFSRLVMLAGCLLFWAFVAVALFSAA